LVVHDFAENYSFALKEYKGFTAANHRSHSPITINYRGADKSLARPGRKQAPATEDFDFNMSYL
jgi:hypothetical protein